MQVSSKAVQSDLQVFNLIVDRQSDNSIVNPGSENRKYEYNSNDRHRLP